MPLHLPTFYKRTASAIVFAIVMLTGLLWNEWAFLALVCIINVLCLRDHFRLMQKIDKQAYWPGWLAPIIVLIGLAAMAGVLSFENKIPLPVLTWLPICLVPALLLLSGALSQKNALAATVQSIAGLLYITLPMAMLYIMRLQHIILPLSLIVMIWINDTMAYIVGSFTGKHPLTPVSPKKTWEGTIGGALLTITAAGIYGYYSHTYRWIDWMALALCATVAGTYGDLLESKLKRLAGVKDSGHLMPGHGGALDRFDSLLIATPFAFVYIIYFMR